MVNNRIGLITIPSFRRWIRMKLIKKLTKILDRITNLVGKVTSWSVVLIVVLILYEVLSRRIFNKPTIWTLEITTMIFGFYFMMIAGYGLLTKSLVSVDVLYNKFTPKTKAMIDLITYTVLFLPFVIGVLYGGFLFALTSWVQKEASWSAFSPPVYPIKTVIPVAMFFLLLQGISEILKKVAVLLEGDELDG